MLGAYGWAYMKPLRKIYYNMTMTLMSAMVAIAIGSIESLGLIADKLNMQGVVWDAVGTLNHNFGTLGYFIIAVFALCWAASVFIYRVRRFDELEVQ